MSLLLDLLLEKLGESKCMGVSTAERVRLGVFLLVLLTQDGCTRCSSSSSSPTLSVVKQIGIMALKGMVF